MKKNLFEKPFVFMRKEYTNGTELVKAMLENWDIAFSVLRRGDVPGFEEISEKVWKMACEKEKHEMQEVCEDIYMAKMLCTLDPSMGGIPYMDEECGVAKIASLPEIGDAILQTDLITDLGFFLKIVGAVRQDLFILIEPKLETTVNKLKDCINEFAEKVKSDGLDEMKEKEYEERKELFLGAFFELAAALQGKVYFQYDGTRYFSEEEFIVEVVEPEMKKGISTVITLFYQLFETEKYQDNFKQWCEVWDRENKNGTYQELSEKWVAFKEYTGNKYEDDWYKRSYDKLPDIYKINDFFTEKNVGTAQKAVLEWMENTVRKMEDSLEKHKGLRKDYELVEYFLKEVNKVIVEKKNKGDEPFKEKRYTSKEKLNLVVEKLEEQIGGSEDGLAIMRFILEGYLSDCLLDVWDERKYQEKKYIGDLLMFPMAEGISPRAQEVAGVINQSKDISLITYHVSAIEQWLRKDDFFSGKESLAELYYELADVITAGVKDNTDRILHDVWKNLGTAYNKMFVDEQQYEMRLKEFSQESAWCASPRTISYLDSPQYYGRIEEAPKVEFFKGKNYEKSASYIRYTRNVKEYNELIDEFQDSMQKYINKLEFRLTDICETAPMGELIQTRANGMSRFDEIEAEGRQKLKKYVDTINEEYQKRFGNISALIKEENNKIKKDKKRKERKKTLRKYRFAIITTLVVMVALVAGGIYFYNRYMTPTYYGTEKYYATGKGCEEYTIHESAKRIAPFIFQNEMIKSIEIPEGVERIEEGAFADCTQLESIVIPASVSYIGEGAFLGCTSLKEVEFAGSITDVSDYAFAHCINLENIKVPANRRFDTANIFENCHSIDVDKVFASKKYSEDFKSSLRNNLYTEIVEGTALLENQVQLMNFLYGKEICSKENGISENLSYLDGKFSNVKITNPGKAGEENARFSFDYEEGIKSFSVEGTLTETVGSGFTWDLNCSRAELMLDDLQMQDEEGYYMKMPDLLSGYSVEEPTYNLNLTLFEDEIVVHKMTSVEQTEETEWLYGYTLQGQLHKDLGKFNFGGTLMVYADGAIEFEPGIAEYVDKYPLGTYRKSDGEEVVFSIDGKRGEHYLVSGANRGRSILIPTWEDEGAYTLVMADGNNYSVHPVQIDWNKDRIVIDDAEYEKISDEVNTLFVEESPIAGIWEGVRTLDGGRKILKRFHILTLGDELVSIAEWIPISDQEGEKYDCTLAKVHFIENESAISIEDIEWVVHPVGHSFSEYEGNVNESYTEMIFDSKNVKCTKVE